MRGSSPQTVEIIKKFKYFSSLKTMQMGRIQHILLTFAWAMPTNR